MLKKLILLVLFVFCFLSDGFSQENSDERKMSKKDAYQNMMYYIKNNFDTDSGKKVVYTLSENFTFEERMMIYEDNKKEATGPFFLNLFLGFGIGSFTQGDKLNGARQLGLSLGGIAVDVIGYALVFSAASQVNNGNDNIPGQFYPGVMLCAAGTCMLIGSTVVGCVKPWTYANKYNNELKTALRVNNASWMSAKPQFAPVIDPINNNYGLIAKINL